VSEIIMDMLKNPTITKAITMVNTVKSEIKSIKKPTIAPLATIPIRITPESISTSFGM
jgi:hypothetical protein